MANPIPDGAHTVTPYMTLKDASRAIEFYARAFGAEEVVRMPGPGGRGVMHAEIKIGDSMVYLSDEMPGTGAKSPGALGGTAVTLHLYVPDSDAAYARAVAAGAKGTMPPADMFWGDRFSQVVDPFGHRWSIATHTEDLTPEQMGQRADEFFAAFAAQAQAAKKRKPGKAKAKAKPAAKRAAKPAPKKAIKKAIKKAGKKQAAKRR
jgi:uncharacterized glyoxalase superfamily protein PhnB